MLVEIRLLNDDGSVIHTAFLNLLNSYEYHVPTDCPPIIVIGGTKFRGIRFEPITDPTAPTVPAYPCADPVIVG